MEDRLVWSPALEPAVEPVGELEVKLGSLVTLVLLTLISGFAPLLLFRRQGAAELLGTRGRALGLISPLCAGVFLATCLLDLLPVYLSAINEALSQLGITLRFPLQEFVLAMGLFLVVVVEQVMLSYSDARGPLEESDLLLGAEGRGPVPDQAHLHVDMSAHSPVRAALLVGSLSLHSVLEGVGVGQMGEGGKVLESCLALLLHKCLLAFSVTLKLGQGRVRPRVLLGCLLLFSFMAPLGIGLGVAMSDSSHPLQRLANSVLRGIATGTYLYITLLEVLPHELGSGDRRILRLIAMLLGFSLVTAILFIKI